MISKNTVRVYPAQLTYPLTQRSLLPDFRDVFPSGFGPKVPYQFPQGGIAINAAASRAQAMAHAATIPKTGSSGGGVVKPSGQVVNTQNSPSGGGGTDFLSNLLGGVNIGSSKVGSIVLVGGFIMVMVIVLATRGGHGGGGKKRKHRRRRRH